MTSAKFQTRELTVTALCTALIAVCAQITIPLPGGVPVTLQTFAVALCGFLLAPKFAELAVVVYLLLGAVGVPVFSSFTGGAAALFGKTGGFLLGFLAMVFLCSLSKKKVPALALSIAGLAVLHLAGIFQYMLISHLGFIPTALAVSVPFLAKDVVSIILALLFAERLRKILRLGTMA